jgi:hypothetical protein
MISEAKSVLAGLGVSGATVAALAQMPAEPVPWLMTIIVALGAFTGWLIKSMGTRQDRMHRDNLVQARAQTAAMRDCVAELKRLNQQEADEARAIREMPEQVAERVAELLDRQRKTA